MQSVKSDILKSINQQAATINDLTLEGFRYPFRGVYNSTKVIIFWLQEWLNTKKTSSFMMVYLTCKKNNYNTLQYLPEFN